MGVKVFHTMGDLHRDMQVIAKTTKPRMAKVVASNARHGNRLAKASAKVTAGAHGKLYHKAFRADRVTALEWHYGPESSMPQGDMSFERGSRNQPPHLDLLKSTDTIGPKYARDIDKLMGRVFWP